MLGPFSFLPVTADVDFAAPVIPLVSNVYFVRNTEVGPIENATTFGGVGWKGCGSPGRLTVDYFARNNRRTAEKWLVSMPIPAKLALHIVYRRVESQQ